MKFNIKRFLFLLLCVCFVFGSVGIEKPMIISASAETSSREELETKLAEIDEKLADLKEKKSDTEEYINALDEKLAYLKQQYSLTRKEVEETKEKISQLENSIEENTKLISDIHSEIEALQSKSDQLNDEFSSTQDLYLKRIRAIYISGDFSSSLAFLFESDSLENLYTRLQLLELVSKSDGKLLTKVKNQSSQIISNQQELIKKENELNETQNTLQSNSNDLSLQQVSLAQKQQEMASTQNTMEKEQYEANTLLKQINEETKEYSEYHDLTEADIEEIDNTISKAEEEYTKSEETPSKNEEYISLTYPCPSYKKITCSFGEYYGHTGCDFSTNGNENQEVVAADSGTVLVSRDITCDISTCKKSYHGGGYCSYGRYIVIRHDNLTSSGKVVYTLYAHNNTRLVSAGEHVEKGEVIAYSGSTGNSTGPHIHFEVRVGGSSQDYAVDPEYYL